MDANSEGVHSQILDAARNDSQPAAIQRYLRPLKDTITAETQPRVSVWVTPTRGASRMSVLFTGLKKFERGLETRKKFSV